MYDDGTYVRVCNDCHDIVPSGSSDATIGTDCNPFNSKISFVGIIFFYGNFGHRVIRNTILYYNCNKKYQKLNRKKMG